MMGVLACGFFAVSCASPGITRLSQPIATSPLAGNLANPAKLAPETSAILHEKRLAAVYRNDPGEAIAELREGLSSNTSAADRLAVIELCSDTGDRLADKEPRRAVGYHLAAAELAFEAALKEASNAKTKSPLLATYNHSAGRVAKVLFDSGHRWNDTAIIEGPWKSYRLRSRTAGDSRIDPDDFDSLEAADYIELKNYEMERIRHMGIGAAMIAHRKGTPEHREVNPFLSPIGMTVPVNAVLDFRSGGDEAELKLSDLLLKDRVVVRGRTLPMTADLTLPLAVQVDYDVDRKKGFRAMTHPDEYLEHTGLYLLEPFRPDQIPVIFVHGLMSNPEVWVDALNELRADPALVRKYQFLVFRYPTGLPVIYNVASLRKRLKEFQERYDPNRSNHNLRRMMLIGHSMGGVLSNAQIRGSGDVFTDYVFSRPIAQIGDLDDVQKATLQELLLYDANPDITRTVFVAAPHRGADMAGGAIGSLGQKLIRFPRELLMERPLEDIDGMTERGKALIVSRPDSIGSLKPDAPILTAILENPVRNGVTIHSIVAQHQPNRPLAESSDKLVPYPSAHLDEAVSEKVIVDATHTSICHRSEAIEEIRRILYLHAGRGAP